MLVGFSVSNYKSFKQTQKISFEASKVIRHKNHVTIKNNKRILKSGLIFGANAGGKSNLVKAIRFSREIILNGCHFLGETEAEWVSLLSLGMAI